MNTELQPVYLNQRADSLIRAVEFSRVGNEHYCFFRLDPAADRAPLIQWLQQSGQQVVSQQQHGGDTMLVTHGATDAAAMLQFLNGRGEQLAAPLPVKRLDAWKWRGILSVVGQSLQLGSSFSSVEKGSDSRATLSFAGLNLIANVMNYVFGAQEKKDPHQLQMLKEKFNAQVTPVVGQQALLRTDESRISGRPKDATRTSLGAKTYDFLQRYSVTGGEIGLRVVGSAALAFQHPVLAVRELKAGGSPGAAFKKLCNSNPATFRVGLVMLLGKFVSLLSKEPDPYNPQPTSMLRSIREKYTFKASSIIEAGAAAYMGADKYKNNKIKLPGIEEPQRDILNAAGNAVFVAGYGIRLGAPYGTLEVDMPELYAHISDTLAKAPREKLPELLASTAAELEKHFGDDKHRYGTIYGKLAQDLQRYHNITLDAPMAESSVPAENKPTPVVSGAQYEQAKKAAQMSESIGV